MARLYLIPGHGDGDPGAGGWCGGAHYDEAERVRALASRIAELGGEQVELAPFDRDCYKDQGIVNWAIPQGAQVVELHMDSAGAGARGGHVIIDDSLSPDAYDVALAGRIAEMFPGRANPIANRGDLQNVNQAARAGIPYRLVENGFISDEGDLATFNARMDDLARIYLDVFGISTESEDDMFTDQDREKLDQLVRTDDVSGRGTVENMYGRVCCLGADTKAIIAAVGELRDEVMAIKSKVENLGE